MRQGSPEWFREKSLKEIHQKFVQRMEGLRQKFYESYNPDKLADMSDEELLRKVFGRSSSAMVRQLILDENYKHFGSTGKYIYTGVVYQEDDGTWKYKEGKNSEVLRYSDALRKAVEVRDNLLRCVNAIQEIGVFKSIYDYERLEKMLSSVFFADYQWVIKYYQMLFPQYFPGMYSNEKDKTLYRALRILGLPDHGRAHKLMNAGEISLFIRKCDINNIAFNAVYAEEWKWKGEKPPCENAAENGIQRTSIMERVNLDFYSITWQPSSIESVITEIEESLEQSGLEGKERESLRKIRVNQGVFRELMIKKYNKCCLCGVDMKELLIASHIKPWSKSESGEKLDPNNGLMLCANHDKLFDSGYITFDDNGSIIISSKISVTNRIYINVSKSMSIKMNDNTKVYMKYHRDNVFQE